MATVTSSRRRSERASGSTKVAASTPKPRQTSVGNRGAQQGPLKPATRTSSETRNPNRVRAGLNQINKPLNPGTPGRVTGTTGRAKPATPARVTTSKPSGGLVNSNKPSMRQIQAKAEAARAQAAGQPGIKGPIKLPNSQRAGVNLPRTGAQVVKPPAGQMSPARIAALKAQGAAAKASAQQSRANKVQNEARRSALNLKNATKNLQGLKAAASALGGARSLGIQAIAESVAPRPTASYATLAAGQKKAAATIAQKKAQMGPAMPKRLANAPKAPKLPSPKETAAQNFDKSFAAARKAGKSVFTWRGNKYNTKLKGEK